VTAPGLVCCNDFEIAIKAAAAIDLYHSRHSPLHPYLKWASYLGTEMKSHLLFTVALSLLVVPCWSADHGQIPNDLPDHVRSWFKSVKSRSGTPCCDIADGHRTTWRAGKNGYEVPIEGVWHEVPPEAVVYNAGNPIDEAIVWYVGEGIDTNGKPAFYIRCFVPGDGA
jgi:hypothetical protein